MRHHGSFCWYELLAGDVVHAQTFYREVVGWGARDAGHPDVPYTLFLGGHIPVAGLVELPPHMREGGARPSWMGYVGVEDVDTCVAQASSLGGTVHRPPADIPGIGRFAIMADPQGALIAAFKPYGEPPPPAAPHTPGQVGWHELMAADADSAFEFYRTLFGWTKADAIEIGAMGTYQMFATGGEAVGGMMTTPAQVRDAGWRYYINVESVAAAARRVVEAGGAIVHDPSQVPGGNWIVQGDDPQGVGFALVSATK